MNDVRKEDARKSIKCVVWDLDNTLWKGVLLEDREVVLMQDTVRAIEVLDNRGILQSIASKNEFDYAIEKLKQFGLHEYFLYPQINWNSKASSIKAIATSINIGLDSIAFVDDDQAELDEVNFSHPEVTCLASSSVDYLLSMPETNPRYVTQDAKIRRQMYINDQQRNKAEAEFIGPKEEFLESLNMKFTIAPAEEGDLLRAEELTLRTNQLNTTGLTFSYDELDALRRSDKHKLFIAELEDKFGKYGKIGLTLIECSEDVWTIKLLLMSCRVMTRGVGSIMINYIRQLARRNRVRLITEFIPTGKNRMMLMTYKFNGFSDQGKAGDLLILESNQQDAIAFPQYVDLHTVDSPDRRDHELL